MNRRRSLMMRLVLSATLIVVGCSQQSDQVIVYVAVDRSHAEPILDAFQQKTGIQVRAIYDSEAAKTTGLVARLLSEEDRPTCDVFWNNELAQTCLLARVGLLTEYHPPGAESVPADFKSRSGLWTAVANRARVIVYNTNLVSREEIPHSIFDLADDKWRGKVAIANPQFGTTKAHVAALFAVLGKQKAQNFLEQLLANQVQIVDGNAMVKNMVARHSGNSGGVLIGLTDTDDVCEGQSAGEPVGMVFPDQESIGTFLCPSTVSVIQHAPHSDAARQLVDYLTSPDVESKLCTEASGYMRIRRTAAFEAREAHHRWFDISDEQLLDQLEESSRWTLEHFQQ